jgi:hypothetical protein
MIPTDITVYKRTNGKESIVKMAWDSASNSRCVKWSKKSLYLGGQWGDHPTTKEQFSNLVFDNLVFHDLSHDKHKADVEVELPNGLKFGLPAAEFLELLHELGSLPGNVISSPGQLQLVVAENGLTVMCTASKRFADLSALAVKRNFRDHYSMRSLEIGGVYTETVDTSSIHGLVYCGQFSVLNNKRSWKSNPGGNGDFEYTAKIKKVHAFVYITSKDYKTPLTEQLVITELGRQLQDPRVSLVTTKTLRGHLFTVNSQNLDNIILSWKQKYAQKIPAMDADCLAASKRTPSWSGQTVKPYRIGQCMEYHQEENTVSKGLPIKFPAAYEANLKDFWVSVGNPLSDKILNNITFTSGVEL